jgi:hypothetical protein
VKAPKWPAAVDKDGKLHLDSPNGFKAWVKTLANTPVEVIVRKVQRQRSRNQNAFWWSVVVPMFAEECGYQPHEHEAVHDELMRVLVGMKPDAHPELKIRQSSTEMSTEDFNILIEQAQIFGATKLGIVIPDPDVNWRQTKRGRKTAA